ncbi:hypothetical protein A4G99_06015 [Haladaptatus sp. R4]|uniref:hypothetical protein n=1 Tax=Haladaptatus sp. R4 TaxID=1679489 RepID=UPI0007B49D63|nr:hypothetical protein [Haladaptatus sp. R4]KZN24026.1 hypothetical protein A4G99_06015 [Haladaptatus sp. R4]
MGAVATLAAVGAGATQVIGKNGLPIELTQVASEEEFVVFENTSMDDVDVSGYVVAFEYGNPDTDQRRTLPDDTVIGNGQSFIVATGAKRVPEADVKFDYEGEVLNNDDEDVVALLTPDESTVIAKGTASSVSDTTTTDGSESGGDDGSDETTTTETEDGSADETTDDGGSTDTESENSGSSNDDTTEGESDDSGTSNGKTTEKSGDDDSDQDC